MLRRKSSGFTGFADLPVKLSDFGPYNILLVLEHGQFLLDLIRAVGLRRGDIQRQQQLAGLSGHLLPVGFCFFLKFQHFGKNSGLGFGVFGGAGFPGKPLDFGVQHVHERALLGDRCLGERIDLVVECLDPVR